MPTLSTRPELEEAIETDYIPIEDTSGENPVSKRILLSNLTEFLKGALPFVEQSSTVVTSWSGIWADPVSGSVPYTLLNGNVDITIPNVLATANSAGFITSTVALPIAIRPVIDIYEPIRISDDGSIAWGMAVVRALTGLIEIYKNASEGSFGGSSMNQSGFYAIGIGWRV